MKKLSLSAALLALVLALPFYSYSAETQNTPKAEEQKPVEPKEFIGEDAPGEILDLIFSVTEANLKSEKFISTGRMAGVNDYWFKEFETNHGTARVLDEYRCSKDEKGNLVPWTCEGETVALVFVDKKISWYKSAEAKAMFERATK